MQDTEGLACAYVLQISGWSIVWSRTPHSRSLWPLQALRTQSSCGRLWPRWGGCAFVWAVHTPLALGAGMWPQRCQGPTLSTAGLLASSGHAGVAAPRLQDPMPMDPAEVQRITAANQRRQTRRCGCWMLPCASPLLPWDHNCPAAGAAHAALHSLPAAPLQAASRSRASACGGGGAIRGGGGHRNGSG